MRPLLALLCLGSTAFAQQQPEPPKSLPEVRRIMEDYAVNVAAKCYDDANAEIAKLKAELEKLKPKEESK